MSQLALAEEYAPIPKPTPSSRMTQEEIIAQTMRNLVAWIKTEDGRAFWGAYVRTAHRYLRDTERKTVSPNFLACETREAFGVRFWNSGNPFYARKFMEDFPAFKGRIRVKRIFRTKPVDFNLRTQKEVA